MQQQLRLGEGTSEEARKTTDPELPDGLKIPNFVMNCQRRAMVIVKQKLTGYDYSSGYEGVGAFGDTLPPC